MKLARKYSPKVMSARDLERASSNIKIYDAVLDNPEPETLDPEMDKFQSMLQEYLTSSFAFTFYTCRNSYLYRLLFANDCNASSKFSER